jgi:pimeloyl-ACP methyl ester carboxylesterase
MTIAAANHPGVARGMFLIEPIFLPREFYGIPIHVDQHPLARKSIRRRNHWEDASAAKDYLKGKKLFADWDDEILDLYIEHGMLESENGGLELTCSPQREASMFMGGMPYDPWPMLPKIDCPVLMVEGEKSENRPYVHLKKAKGLIPQCDYTLFPGAGHLIPMEKPLEIAVMVKTFAENLIRTH